MTSSTNHDTEAARLAGLFIKAMEQKQDILVVGDGTTNKLPISLFTEKTKVIILGNPEVGTSAILNKAIDNCHKHGIMVHPSMLADDYKPNESEPDISTLKSRELYDRISEFAASEHRKAVFGSEPIYITNINRDQTQAFTKPKSKYHN